MQRDRRSGEDRRQSHLRAAIYGLFLGRRKSPRREIDKINGYIIDYVEPHIVIIIILPVILSILDALFTLCLLTKGGSEINPIMEILINQNPAIFFVFKLLLTTVGLIVTFLFRYFKVIGKIYGIHLLYCILGVYICLICYELYLLI